MICPAIVIYYVNTKAERGKESIMGFWSEFNIEMARAEFVQGVMPMSWVHGRKEKFIKN